MRWFKKIRPRHGVYFPSRGNQCYRLIWGIYYLLDVLI